MKQSSNLLFIKLKQFQWLVFWLNWEIYFSFPRIFHFVCWRLLWKYVMSWCLDLLFWIFIETMQNSHRNVLTNAAPPLIYKHISWRFRSWTRHDSFGNFFHQIQSRPAFLFLKDIIKFNTSETYLARCNRDI